MENKPIPQQLKPADLAVLQAAKHDMENLGFAIKAVNSIGTVAETGMKFLPDKVLKRLQKATKDVLMGVVKANLLTIKKNKEFKQPSKNMYKTIVTGSGALSGFLGSSTGIGTAVFIGELSLTTKFLMRTIMDIARSEGEDIYSLEGQMACLEVFALGSTSKEDDDVGASYYATRATLSRSIQKVSAVGMRATLDNLVLTASSLGSKSLSNFVSKIAARFSILLSEKFMAQVLPVVGAATGGTLNYIFVSHFQKMATAHFRIRRLEREYGEEIVKDAYQSLGQK